jgi:hypothetical protein
MTKDDAGHGSAGYIVSKLRVHDVVAIFSVHDVLTVVKYAVGGKQHTVYGENYDRVIPRLPSTVYCLLCL